MRLSVFRENDSVLLLGEGNFSFAVSLLEHNLPIAITASCFEFSVTQASAKRNFEYLEAHGVRTLLGVDGTKLSEHPVIGKERFDKIVFNFPHVGGKMRIEKNRELLKNFFASAGKLMKREALVLLTLCNGQGGTIRDCPRRRWDDSWKVTEMAAYGNFVLTSVEPFCVSNFGNYTSTGYRSLDKEFNVEKSLTHFFKRVDAPAFADFAPIAQLDSSKFEKEDNEITYQKILPDTSVDAHFLCPFFYKFDTTFSVCPDFEEIELYRVLYNFFGRIIKDVEFVRSYRFDGTEKVTRTYRISYQSNDFPLYRERIVDIHQNIIAKILEDHLNVVVTRFDRPFFVSPDFEEIELYTVLYNFLGRIIRKIHKDL